MTRIVREWAKGALALALLAMVAGCIAAAAAGAGAGGGYYFTSRGVGSTVNGTVDNVASRAQAVLGDEGVTITETKSEGQGDKRFFKGTKGELDISVELERKGPTTTKAEVSARKNLVEWDKGYAQTVLDKIVKRQ